MESSATNGRPQTDAWATPTVASNPISAGPSRSPLRSTTSPSATSTPTGRMSWPGLAAARMCTRSSSRGSVSSTMTTASAPSGTGAPVVMYATWPGCNVKSGRCPAVAAPTTG
ncbi:MAG: hypothetical protein R2851_22875 [Caldilineaceae bacterium]